MPAVLPHPPHTAFFHDLGDLLQINAPAGTRMMDLRVDGGLVFARWWIAIEGVEPASGWQQMSVDWTMHLFTENSQAATWLRRHGVDILRMVMLKISDAEATI